MMVKFTSIFGKKRSTLNCSIGRRRFQRSHIGKQMVHIVVYVDCRQVVATLGDKWLMFSLDGWYLNQARHFFCVSKLCQQVVLVQIAKLTLTEYLLGQESSPYPLPTGEHTVGTNDSFLQILAVRRFKNYKCSSKLCF